MSLEDPQPTDCIRRPRSYWTTCTCTDCTRDRLRAHKLYNAGRPYRVPSEIAWRVLEEKIEAGWTALAISSATGLSENLFSDHLTRYRRTGERRYLSPATAAALVNIGRPTKGQVGATPSRRRLRALAAIGWALEDLAAESGVGFSTLAMVRNRNGRVTAKVANAIEDVYDRLHMTVGPNPTVAAMARRKKWPPPLAFEDIDDLGEEPRDWGYTTSDRATAIRDLADMGLGITEACRRLKTSRDALEKWCQRHGMSDIYVQLTARETAVFERRNQHTRESAA